MDFEYGLYDFVTLGFPYIREHFKNSVFPLLVKYDRQGNEINDIGSAFITHSGVLVTAGHCLQSGFNITIPGFNSSTNKIEKICKPHDSNIDIACIYFSKRLLPKAPGLMLSPGNILDEVVVMGFPPIPGFETILVTEKAAIAGELQATVGQVIGSHSSYLGKQRLMLISARVKGGNSGGPVISKYGKVIGVVTEQPLRNGLTDGLGYGVVTPSETIFDFFKDCDSGKSKNVEFKPTEVGILVE